MEKIRSPFDHPNRPRPIALIDGRNSTSCQPMKQRTTLLAVITLLFGLTACDQESSEPIEALAVELAEAHGVEDYTLEIVATLPLPEPDADDEDRPDDLASAPSDPEELRQMWCGAWGDGSGCVTCVLTLGECSFWADNCGGGAYNTCN